MRPLPERSGLLLLAGLTCLGLGALCLLADAITAITAITGHDRTEDR